MRMIHYFGALALLLVPALVATAVTGVVRHPRHLEVGLVTAILAVATHTLMILFMVVTGRVLKSAMATRPLPRAFLDELNQFFARKAAYPVAVLSAFAIVAAAVLGYAPRAFGLDPTVHVVVGLGAAVLNLWALGIEVRTLLENQDLIDRTARQLDQLDAERAAGGEPPPEGPEEPGPPPAVRWTLAAASAWLPYLYWGLFVWRGEFGEVDPRLPAACAAASFVFLVLALRSRRASAGER